MNKTLGLLLLALAACSGTEDDKSATGSDTEATDDIFKDDVSPGIVEGTFSVIAGSESSGLRWYVEIEGDDPQGSGTLANIGGSLKVETAAGGEVFEQAGIIVCNNSGDCSCSFAEDTYGAVDTSSPENYRFFGMLEDEDGNFSDYVELDYDEIFVDTGGDTGRR